ncbi:DUF6080 domain-containing protein [Saccharibacillus kuerlensis]|uniref:Glycosyltransferase RgtA/B/C/D-like domain-containing protein n=1 Tax=Saccharibacillus kuerlensis TaxID=459527 RepID=A0ABQ2L4Q9_9BACL|nr:DUF6080 domain-containing protein [Saccharibacillus kuerlensis]GGO03186.1 hypothetical protein GCM10010969_27190 [Saccharibacillus kuerlensis]
MNFVRYLFAQRRTNAVAAGLCAALALFYVLLNLPYISYMSDHTEMLQSYNPFFVAQFPLNLFNFDPSMYYGTNSSSVIHPLMSLLAVPLGMAADAWGGNLFFLILQSLLNGASAALLLIYLSKKDDRLLHPLLFSALFGLSSYLIFSSLIPDSYPYVQFGILLSVVYLQYGRAREAEGEEVRIWPNAGFAALQFGLTSTNAIPFGVALLGNMKAWRSKKSLNRFIRIVLLAILIAAAATGLQYLCFGKMWISGWMDGLHGGGMRYATLFNPNVHGPVFYMLGINPILTPYIHLLNPDSGAFVTDIARGYPLHVHLTGLFILLLAAAGFVRGIRSREVWIAASYIGFAALLHLVIGFGLAVYQYDLYLYAGHYLFAFFLLGGVWTIGLRQGLFKKIITGLLLIAVLVTAANNVYLHTEALRVVNDSFAAVEAGSAAAKE